MGEHRQCLSDKRQDAYGADQGVAERNVAEAMSKSGRANVSLRTKLGQSLKALREARRLTQRELGLASHLSSKFIIEVEHARKSISLDNLSSIAAALGVPLVMLTDDRTDSLAIRDSADIKERIASLAAPARSSRLRDQDARHIEALVASLSPARRRLALDVLRVMARGETPRQRTRAG